MRLWIRNSRRESCESLNWSSCQTWSRAQSFHEVIPIRSRIQLSCNYRLFDCEFSYLCEFRNVASTKLHVLKISELVWFNETLEAYQIQRCSNYPKTTHTTFAQIHINTDRGLLRPNWTIANRIADCGQHAKVPNPSEVNIFYRAERGSA
jgi:hypothetical protein